MPRADIVELHLICKIAIAEQPLQNSHCRTAGLQPRSMLHRVAYELRYCRFSRSHPG